ncbi:MAG: type II secretion system protein, partial [bacterium]|nr:type II secretion system protein [bacterium]
MKRLAFTLAEVLITLAIIGVVAAISIPSVISNSQQQEFKTGLRKAVSVLNSAITMNMALDGETPYDNANTFGYLMKHMSILKSTTDTRALYMMGGGDSWHNAAFYTTDGMRFEFRVGGSQINKNALYENPSIFLCSSNL